ncbi:MAG: hypothetical protein ABJG68_02575 [Crocinitomicaceae bacterium]
MRFSFIFVCALTLLACNQTPPPIAPSDLKDFNLNGNVKTTEEYSVKPDDSLNTSETRSTYYHYFNPEGYIDSSVRKIEPLGYRETTIYERDEFNYNIQTSKVDQEGKSTFQLQKTFSNGKISNSEFTSAGLKRSADYEYDEQDSLIKTISYNNEGEIIETTDYTYETLGRTLISKVKFYDKNELLIKSEVSEFNPDNYARLNTYTVYENSKPSYSTYRKVSCNENKDPIKIESSSPMNVKSFRTYQYTYDDQNNWTTKIEFIDGVKTSTTYRTIEYYSK